MPFGIQPIHIVVVIIVALIIFGPKRLPEVGRWVGRSITEFRKGTQEMTSALRDEMNRVPSEDQEPSIAKPVPNQSISTDRQFCTKCGSPNSPDALFCSKCGNSLRA